MTQDTELTAELTARVKAEAGAVGFARVGVAEAQALEEEAVHLDAWLAAGRHGQMSWMAETASVRKDPRNPNMLENAKSVIVMAAPYVQRDGFEGPPRRPRCGGFQTGVRARVGGAGGHRLRREELLPDHSRGRLACLPCLCGHDRSAELR